MILHVDHLTWQTLRLLVRSRGKPLRGYELRPYPARRNKGGMHLKVLLRLGLIVEAGKPLEPGPNDPLRFRNAVELTAYALTDAGEFAAEYGEYDCDRERVALPDQPWPQKEKVK